MTTKTEKEERKFCLMVASGRTFIQSYREAFNQPFLSDSLIKKLATQLMLKKDIRERISVYRKRGQK